MAGSAYGVYQEVIGEKIMRIGLFLALILSMTCIQADDDVKIELDTTVIKGNKELPKILYVVPWKDMKDTKKSEQTLVLHSLYGDLFEPVVGEAPAK